MTSIDSKILKNISKEEKISIDKLEKRIKENKIVILGKNDQKYTAIGKSLKTKVNVNLGSSSARSEINEEIYKAKIAQKYQADTISDCSMSDDNKLILKSLISSINLPIITVPIYQTICESKSFMDITDEDILKTIENQVKEGISSIVIHSGFKKEDLTYLKKKKRIIGTVSKGGAMCSAISLSQDIENPMFSIFEDIIEIIKDENIVLNLGNAMRSGCIHDFKDSAQYREIINNAKLAKIANKNNIQVIIEGLGGHVNAHNLGEWISEHNRITGDKPLFVSGPIPTEIGLGYDHISAAIGGAMASGYGADFLCAITPSEHLSLPKKEDIKKGVISAKIAAHVGDSIKYGIDKHFEDDLNLSKYRAKKDWRNQFEFALDPEGAKSIHPQDNKACSMCGKFCAISIMQKYLF